MSNDRLWITCVHCGERFLLAKWWGMLKWRHWSDPSQNFKNLSDFLNHQTEGSCHARKNPVSQFMLEGD